jgi:hypothetical protein
MLVIEEAPSRKTKGGQPKTRWNCLCECGITKVVDRQSLTCGRVRSCGCLAKELLSDRNRTHGRTRTKEYRAWAHAKDRCHRKTDARYHIYGARGISMCPEWRNSFEQFFADMGPAPEGFTLERRDSNKGYCPENCIWADRITQANNTCTNRIVEFHGKKMTLAQCARSAGVVYKSLHHFVNFHRLPTEQAVELATSL